MIRLRVNGGDRRAEIEPRLLLSDFLRHELGLTGTHVGCEHGVCGACTVELDGVAVRSCLMLAVQADGCECARSRACLGPAAGGVPPASRVAVRLLHAGHPDRGDRPPRAGARRPARRSSTCSSGHLCRCTGYTPIVDAIEEVARAMNLARSLLVACERFPEREALPGHHLPRAARRACSASPEASRSSRGERVALVLDNRVETALLYWAAQWAGAVAVPLSWRLSGEELDYCLADCGAARTLARRRSAARRAARIRARSSGTTRETVADALHLGHDRPAEGRAALAPRRSRGGALAGLQHGYRTGERTLGVMPLYHTMGIHSLLAMHLVGGCFVPQARLDAAAALELIAEQRVSALYLAPTLFYDLLEQLGRRASTPRRCARSAYAGAAMTSSLVERCCQELEPEIFVNHYGSTEIYTCTIGDDQRRKPGCAGRPAVNTRMRLTEAARSASTSPPTRRSPATGTAPTPTRRRSRTAGTRRATPATSTRTATSGSTAASTT